MFGCDLSCQLNYFLEKNFYQIRDVNRFQKIIVPIVIKNI
jgi:hypothetical protein